MAQKRGCPIDHTNFLVPRPALGHYAVLNRLREESRFHWNDSTPNGFWMVHRYEDVREALTSTTAFTCEVTNAMNVPREIDIIPNMLDGEAHLKIRRVLNPFFSPAAVRRMEQFALDRCIALIEDLRPTGSCDLVADFAIRYPTEIFLAQLGLPLTDAEFFLPWVETVFGGLMGDDKAGARAASLKIMEYFDTAVHERRSTPLDPTEDLVSRLVEARIDGEPIPHQDILTICMTLMLAGLDTTRSALGYIYRHLAENVEDRRQLVADPALIPNAVEECLRLYPLVIQAGRLAPNSVTFNGLDIEAGEVMWLGIGTANRDPRKFPDPDRYDPRRQGVNQHLAFGAGPHRCLGMHIARLELNIVLREWHKRIPDYRITPGTELVERGGQLTLRSLPLEWDV